MSYFLSAGSAAIRVKFTQSVSTVVSRPFRKHGYGAVSLPGPQRVLKLVKVDKDIKESGIHFSSFLGNPCRAARSFRGPFSGFKAQIEN